MGTTTKTTQTTRGRPKKVDPAAIATVEKMAAEIEAATTKGKKKSVGISPPNFETAVIVIRGTSPLVVHAFSQKSQEVMQAAQEAGSQNRKGKAREARIFEDNYQAARHLSTEGWDGIHAGAFRQAMISACKVVGFKMTLAKLSLFVEADGYDARGTPLVRITGQKPHMDIRPARNSNGGTDLRARPMWNTGEWGAKVRVRWDADQFSATDIANLMARVGMQVGICEGRADSKFSAGCGWGSFELVN